MMTMPFVAPEVILKAKEMDLLTYLKNYEPYELVRISGNAYCTKTHDSLKISNGKWMWWSRGFGGYNALDYLIKVKGMTFLDAVETIVGHTAVCEPVYEKAKERKEVPLLLPDKSTSTDKIFKYLFGRGIDVEIINYCIANELIMESLPYHNLVFIGYDEEKKPKYAAYRSTNEKRIMGDCSGSKKEYSFRLVSGKGNEVHLFECAMDLLSYATLLKMNGKDFRSYNLLSLAGVYQPKKEIGNSKVPAALTKFLEQNKNISRIVLHLDNDKAGRIAAKTLQTILPKEYEVIDDPPPYGKDFNDFLQLKLNIRQKKERSFER